MFRRPAAPSGSRAPPAATLRRGPPSRACFRLRGAGPQYPPSRLLDWHAERLTFLGDEHHQDLERLGLAGILEVLCLLGGFMEHTPGFLSDGGLPLDFQDPRAFQDIDEHISGVIVLPTATPGASST